MCDGPAVPIVGIIFASLVLSLAITYVFILIKVHHDRKFKMSRCNGNCQCGGAKVDEEATLELPPYASNNNLNIPNPHPNSNMSYVGSRSNMEIEEDHTIPTSDRYRGGSSSNQSSYSNSERQRAEDFRLLDDDPLNKDP